MPATSLDPVDLLISSGLDLSRPFTTRTALSVGLSFDHLALMLTERILIHPMRGCFFAAHLEDSLELRASCLRLIVPSGCVVTDRTAGWLHGASMILAPGDHLTVPTVSVFDRRPGHRLRNSLSTSGERSLSNRDVTEVQGIAVTTPLRTACDLGRLLRQEPALAAIDAMLRLGAFSREQMADETRRFRGYRGVRQLRALVPLADGGSESFGESVLRLRWYQGGAPGTPETQIDVFDESGLFVARVDMGIEAWRYAAEYDGVAFHGPDQAEHDDTRRERLRELGWIVDVFRGQDVFGRKQDADVRLRRGASAAKVRFHAGSAY